MTSLRHRRPFGLPIAVGFLLGAGVLSVALGTAPAVARPRAQAGSTSDSQLAKLFLGSAWCSFSYNATSGASHSERAVFSADGTMNVGSKGESYSSGYGGTAAGASSDGQQYYWKIKGGALLMSSDGQQWQAFPVGGSLNSSGNVILKIDGKEYTRCN